MTKCYSFARKFGLVVDHIPFEDLINYQARPVGSNKQTPNTIFRKHCLLIALALLLYPFDLIVLSSKKQLEFSNISVVSLSFLLCRAHVG